MRGVRVGLAAWLLGAACASDVPDAQRPESVGCEGCTVLTGGQLFDGEAIAPATVVLRGQRIEKVVRQPVKVVGGQEVTLGGATVLPGLIDLHVHLFALSGPRQSRYEPAEVQDVAAAHLKALLRAGVTSFLDLGSSQARILE